jgi:hypothetical protein
MLQQGIVDYPGERKYEEGGYKLLERLAFVQVDCVERFLLQYASYSSPRPSPCQTLRPQSIYIENRLSDPRRAESASLSRIVAGISQHNPPVQMQVVDTLGTEGLTWRWTWATV